MVELKSKSYFKQLAAQFTIYADFQSLLKGVWDSDKENNTTYIEKYQKHSPYSFAYIVECFDDKFSKPVVLYSRKMQPISLLNQFLKSMIIEKVIKYI